LLPFWMGGGGLAQLDRYEDPIYSGFKMIYDICSESLLRSQKLSSSFVMDLVDDFRHPKRILDM